MRIRLDNILLVTSGYVFLFLEFLSSSLEPSRREDLTPFEASVNGCLKFWSFRQFRSEAAGSRLRL